MKILRVIILRLGYLQKDIQFPNHARDWLVRLRHSVQINKFCPLFCILVTFHRSDVKRSISSYNEGVCPILVLVTSICRRTPGFE